MTEPTRTTHLVKICTMCKEIEVKSGDLCQDCLDYLDDLLYDEDEED